MRKSLFRVFFVKTCIFFSNYISIPYFELAKIKTDERIMQKYIDVINEKCPLKYGDAITIAHNICPSLEDFYTANYDRYIKTNNKYNDKGKTGKFSEFALFGNLPNSKSDSDLPNGYDIKTTHFKRFFHRKGLYNAKERLTITNCGSKISNDSFTAIIGANKITQCELYKKKIQKGIVLVFEYEKNSNETNTIENIKNKKLLTIFRYNLDELEKKEQEILEKDYIHIKNCIHNNTITQKGQLYLHIHKHGTKQYPNRCALGFTGNFLTKLSSIFGKKKLVVKGKSIGIML